MNLKKIYIIHSISITFFNFKFFVRLNKYLTFRDIRIYLTKLLIWINRIHTLSKLWYSENLFQSKLVFLLSTRRMEGVCWLYRWKKSLLFKFVFYFSYVFLVFFFCIFFKYLFFYVLFSKFSFPFPFFQFLWCYTLFFVCFTSISRWKTFFKSLSNKIKYFETIPID